MNRPVPLTTVLLPSDACYWVTLPGSGRRLTQERVRSSSAPFLPVDVDAVDLAWTKGRDGTLVIIAIERDRLDQILAEFPKALSAIPASIPPHIAATGVETAALNLLIGNRLPQDLRRWDRRLAATILAASLLTAAILVTGSLLKASQIRANDAAQASASSARIIETLPRWLATKDPDPEMTLEQGRRLTQALTKASGGNEAALVIRQILDYWPTGSLVQISSLSIDSGKGTLEGSSPSLDGAQTLAAAVSSACSSVGWQSAPLQTTAKEGSIAFSIVISQGGPRR
jgi:hypothetical protein